MAQSALLPTNPFTKAANYALDRQKGLPEPVDELEIGDAEFEGLREESPGREISL